MKKQYLAIALLALALGVSACSSKKAESEAELTTAAVETTAESQTAEETSSEGASTDAEELEEVNYYYGFISAVEEGKVTVSDDDGEEAVFDISEAELTGADAVGEGDEVEISYAGELGSDITKASAVDIITSAAEEAEEEAAEEDDLTVSGTVEKADDSSLTLKTEDGTYTFNTIISQKVTKGGINAGVNAQVTYYGDLEDTEDLPVATKIVTDDAKDTEDAKIKFLTGTAAEVATDYIVLDTKDPANTLFSFMGTEGMFDGINTGDTVSVIYEGTLTDKVITALGVK